MTWPTLGTSYSSLSEAKRALFFAAHDQRIPIAITSACFSDKKPTLIKCSLAPGYSCSFGYSIKAQIDWSASGRGSVKWVVHGVNLSHSNHVKIEEMDEEKRMMFAEKMKRKLESQIMSDGEDNASEVTSEEEEGGLGVNSGDEAIEGASVSADGRGKSKSAEQSDDASSLYEEESEEDPEGPARKGEEFLERGDTADFREKLYQLVFTSFLPFPPSPTSSATDLRLQACAAARQRNFGLRLYSRTIINSLTMLCTHGDRKGSDERCPYWIKFEWKKEKGSWEVADVNDKHQHHHVLNEFSAQIKFLIGDRKTYEGAPKSDFQNYVESIEIPPPSSPPPPRSITSTLFLPKLASFLSRLSPTLVKFAPQLLLLDVNSEADLQAFIWLSEEGFDKFLRGRSVDLREEHFGVLQKAREEIVKIE